MASIRKELSLAAPAAFVWQAFRDVGAVHTRLARGFVVDTVADEGGREVTFANGMTVRERIVTVNEGARTLVYSAEGEVLTHHNATFEVRDAGPGRSTVVWTTHLLPDAAAATIDGMMTAGVEAMRRTLEADAAVRTGV